MLARFINDDPLAWVRFLGFEADSAEVLDSDLTSRLDADGEIIFRGQPVDGSETPDQRDWLDQEPAEPKTKDPYSLDALNEHVAVDAVVSMIDQDPIGFLALAGFPDVTEVISVERVTMPDVIEARADHLVKVSGPPTPVTNPDYKLAEDEDMEYILNIVMEPDAANVRMNQIVYRNITAMFKYDLKARTVVAMLRDSANDDTITGYHHAGSLKFWYDVVRMWERSPDEILSAPPVLYPFLALTNVTDTDLPIYLARLRELMGPLPVDYQHELWMRTRVLTGLVYSVETTDNYLKEGCSMPDLRESSTYKEIAGIGRLDGKLDMVRKLLRSRFQPLPETIDERVSVLSADQLDDLAVSMILMSGLSDLERWLSDDARRSS